MFIHFNQIEIEIKNRIKKYKRISQSQQLH